MGFIDSKVTDSIIRRDDVSPKSLEEVKKKYKNSFIIISGVCQLCQATDRRGCGRFTAPMERKKREKNLTGEEENMNCRLDTNLHGSNATFSIFTFYLHV